MAKPQPSQRERQIADVAACAALGLTLDDTPTPFEVDLMKRFGYVDDDGDLTDAGWEAAGDAMGFEDAD